MLSRKIRPKTLGFSGKLIYESKYSALTGVFVANQHVLESLEMTTPHELEQLANPRLRAVLPFYFFTSRDASLF